MTRVGEIIHSSHDDDGNLIGFFPEGAYDLDPEFLLADDEEPMIEEVSERIFVVPKAPALVVHPMLRVYPSDAIAKAAAAEAERKYGIEFVVSKAVHTSRRPAGMPRFESACGHDFGDVEKTFRKNVLICGCRDESAIASALRAFRLVETVADTSRDRDPQTECMVCFTPRGRYRRFTPVQAEREVLVEALRQFGDSAVTWGRSRDDRDGSQRQRRGSPFEFIADADTREVARALRDDAADAFAVGMWPDWALPSGEPSRLFAQAVLTAAQRPLDRERKDWWRWRPEAEAEGEDCTTPEEMVAEAELRASLARARASLSQRDRAALDLDLDDVPREEIARRLSLKTSKHVAVVIHRATKRLAARLKAEIPEAPSRSDRSAS